MLSLELLKGIRCREAERSEVEHDDVGVDVDVDINPGGSEPFGKRLGVRMVLGQAVDIAVQGADAVLPAMARAPAATCSWLSPARRAGRPS